MGRDRTLAADVSFTCVDCAVVYPTFDGCGYHVASNLYFPAFFVSRRSSSRDALCVTCYDWRARDVTCLSDDDYLLVLQQVILSNLF